MNGVSNLLQRAPVHKDGFLAFCRELSEFVLLHPAAYFLERVHGQASGDLLVVADWASVELTQADLINASALGVGADQVAPHLHLTLARVHILLDRVKEGPSMVLWHLEGSFDHFNKID